MSSAITSKQVAAEASRPQDWQELVAVGLVADDVSPAGIARFAGVPLAAAMAALERARAEGLPLDEGPLPARTAAQLVAVLPASRVADIHARAAHRVLGGTPSDLRRGLLHLREAAAAMPTEQLVALADHAGRFALAVGDAEAARDLLLLALEHELGDDLELEAERNLTLSRALSLLGDPAGAQARIMRAVLLAEGCGAASAAVRAAERFALPADWQAGDGRVIGMIERVQRMAGLSEEDRIRLLATRAWVEARLPIARTDEQQVSWIGRPNVARPLAEEALAAAGSFSPETRLLALLAWRHTHRAPQFLGERREAATEALALAEQIASDAEQVEAAVLLAVDALESGDRSTHAAALTTAAAVAERSGDERLRWRALMPASAAALMNDDVEAAKAIAEAAFAAGEHSGAPGLLASRWTFTGHLALRHADDKAIAASFAADVSVLTTSPLGRSGLALLLAREGQRTEAAAHAHATLHQLDEESSLLLTLSRLADVALELADIELADALIPILEPWSGRIVVDANGWWCDGPVDLWLAALLQLRGPAPSERAAALLDTAELLARASGDVRSSRRIAELRELELQGRDATSRPMDPTGRLAALGLTEREREVLQLLAQGATYRRIAEQLQFSVSTVRNDVVAIYRRLGVRGRSEAAAQAVRLGLTLDTHAQPGDQPRSAH